MISSSAPGLSSKLTEGPEVLLFGSVLAVPSPRPAGIMFTSLHRFGCGTPPLHPAPVLESTLDLTYYLKKTLVKFFTIGQVLRASGWQPVQARTIHKLTAFESRRPNTANSSGAVSRRAIVFGNAINQVHL